MNIMLLAMSTFPRYIVPLQAASQEDEAVYSYFTQLEPGCKHLFCKLAKMKKRFDKVIVLCTPEALKGSPDRFVENSIGQKNIDISGVTPYDFYKERMLSYIRNDSSSFKYEKELGIDIEGFAKFKYEGLYPEEELDSLFEIVPVEKGELKTSDAISKVIYRINEMTGAGNTRINLYLNAQGGARTIIQIINTSLNMLKSRKYTLIEVSVVDFNGEKIQNSFPILNVTGDYLMNDLATAMNAFLQYGRGDMFVDYYERYKKERGLIVAPEDSVVRSINSISDAILLCNTEDFLEGIDQLKDSIKEYDLLETKSKDPFFELIVNDIKNSYRELFDSSDVIDDLDVLVDWCLKRKLLQQAVTIVEAKTSDFVFDYGVLYLKKDEETKSKLSRLRRLISPQQDYKFNHPKFYIFNKYCNMNAYRQDNGGKSLYKAVANIDFVNDDEIFGKLVNGEYSFGYKEQGQSIEIRLYSNYITGIDTKDSQAVNNAKNKMRELVAGYRKICYIRNDLNHGNIKLEDTDYGFIENQVRSFNSVLKNFKKISQLMEKKDRAFFEGNDIKRN